MTSSFSSKSGQTNCFFSFCPTRFNDCPLTKALYLHNYYVTALKNMDDINKFQGVRLRMAEFVKEVAQAAPAA